MASEANGSRSFLLKVLLAAIALLLIHCEGSGGVSPDASVPDGPICVPNHQWISLNSTMQLVNKLVNPNFCESGWTELYAERLAEGKGEQNQIPLQPEYVQRFASVRQFGNQLAASWGVLGQAFPTTRFSLSWPCFLESTDIQLEFEEAVDKAQQKGYAIELTLSHRDSYPAWLHKRPASPDFPGMPAGGWTHPEAQDDFAAYLQLVLDTAGPLMPSGSVIYLASEPMADLMDGYLHKGGKFPPGGKGAGKLLAIALINARDAFMKAGRELRTAGFIPAIAPNVRFVQPDNDFTADMEFLDFLYNWWMLDALVNGCIDNDFDGACEKWERPPEKEYAVDWVGVTFYGVMHALTESVEFGLPGGPTRKLLYRHIRPTDFVSNAFWFKDALTKTQERYKERVGAVPVEIGVAEVGFTDTNLTTKMQWLQEYLDVLNALGIKFIGLHGMFEHAEFSTGEFNFHYLARCPETGTEGPCETTEWGDKVLDIIALDCTPVP